MRHLLSVLLLAVGVSLAACNHGNATGGASAPAPGPAVGGGPPGPAVGGVDRFTAGVKGQPTAQLPKNNLKDDLGIDILGFIKKLLD